jgi:CRP/FNR family transcriptional regulator
MVLDACSCEFCDLKDLFYSRLGKKDVEFFCSGKIEKEFLKGEYIIKEGALITDFFYLKSGLVKLFRTESNQKEQIITIAKPFDYVSILSIFSNEHYNYSVQAIEDSVICRLDINHIKDLFKSNGNYAVGLMEKMSEVSDRIINELLEIRKKNLKGRVAYLLIYFYTEIYKSLEYELPISRKEIADYIGMSTENVIRTLSEFRKDKIISINGKVIEIKDLDSLSSISQFG